MTPRTTHGDERDSAHSLSVDEEVEAAGREAANIGGMTPDYHVPEDQRALAEAGQGESEGFELAERDLIASASHEDHTPEPGHVAPPAERLSDHERYGDADHIGPDDDRSDTSESDTG